jgi:hypothetical protein
MQPRDFFIQALDADTYRRKDWVLSVFCVVAHPVWEDFQGRLPYAYQILRMAGDNKQLYFYDALSGVPMPLDGSEQHRPVIGVFDEISLKPGELRNVSKAITTCAGNCLINCYVLVYAFGSKIEFVTGPIEGKKLDQLVIAKFSDYKDFDPTAPRAADRVYVDEFLRYQEALQGVGGFTQINSPAASPKALTIDPAILKRRNALLLEYKDQLNDPAIMARIQKELSQMDIDSFKDDPAKGFYIQKKNFEVQRMKLHTMIGVESGFNDGVAALPVTSSLNDGWDMVHMPSMADSIRAGSFNRGNQTALGGESVKYFYRIFQNTTVAEEDCHTTSGLWWLITVENHAMFDGLYEVIGGTSKVARLDVARLKTLIGSKILIRSPMLCKTVAPSFCARCVGDALARTPTGLHVAASDVGSTFMGCFMAAMHGKALTTAHYSFKESLT